MRFLTTILLAVVLMLVTLTGCMHLRIFQKKVPTDTEKPSVQVEGEKRAAELIQLISAPPVAHPEVAIVAVHEVATGLSNSLGKPLIPVKLEDQTNIINELRSGILAKEKQLEGWKAYGRKYGGMTIEGTGFDIGPLLGTGGLLGVIALCIFVPGFGFVILRVVPVLWGMVRRMATGIEAYSTALPAEGAKLKHAFLGRTMNEIDKRVVDGRKKKIKPAQVEELARTAQVSAA